MRRLIVEEPYSKAAVWSRRLAVFAMAVAIIAVLVGRSGAVEANATLAVIGAAILLACVALLVGAAAAIIIWRTGRRGASIIVASGFLAALVLAYPVWLAAEALRLPLLSDISTDITDPPEFFRSAKAVSARGGITPGSVAPVQRTAQRLHYPLVQPILLDLDAEEAYQLVLKAVTARRLKIVEQAPPGGRLGLGHVDVIDRTLIMGFPDDMTIRIRPLAGQTRIDIRSASRYGRHDFGTNARRIEKFAEELQAQLDAK
jgi:uncharacterized protein (DUF1499 family)